VQANDIAITEQPIDLTQQQHNCLKTLKIFIVIAGEAEKKFS